MLIPNAVGATTEVRNGGNLKKLTSHMLGGAPATTLEAATYQLPDGRVKDYAIVHRPMAAGVIALRRVRGDLEVLLVEQMRPAVNDRHVLEIVAGKMDEPGETDPRLTAQRKLGEEAGLRAEHWATIGANMYPTPGYSDELVHTMAAWGLSEVPKREEDEDIRPLWVPLQTAVEKVVTGVIKDFKTRDAIWSANYLHPYWKVR